MAVCSKCNKKIPIYHLGQSCPHCGVNIRFSNFEKEFYMDAKRAELSLAKMNIFIAHIKASFIGSKLTIARLAVMLLPLLSVLLPYASASLKAPFLDGNIAISGLGLYSAFSGGYLDYILAMMKAGPDAAAFKTLLMACAGVAAIAVISLFVFLFTVLAFISIKKMPKILCALDILGIISAVVTTVFSVKFSSVASASAGSILSGKLSFGFVITIIAFLVHFIINFIIIKKGLPIEYKEGDLERKEIAKKVKNGELKLEDLPQPIVETEETRKIQEEIDKQQSLYRHKEGGNDDEEV